ncbi:MAG: diaminopropionate ammonia-lyase, partial [Gemmatimonadota bacterium]
MVERPGPRGSATETRTLDDAGFEAAAAEIRSWPEYRPTPLLRLSGPARVADVAGVWYKDESHRFGTGTFKALGGAYGVVR